MKPKVLIAVVGPTAIGKTNLGIQIAQHFDAEIISADSRQFFKEMQIGTAVPSAEELEAATHHFIQHLSIKDPYSVGDFERDALQQLDELYQVKDMAVMVGGSGLYVDAVVRGLDKFPEVDPSIRESLNTLLENNGIKALQQMLESKDPEYYQIVDRGNPHRLIRALEVCITSNQPYSSFLGRSSEQRSFKTLYIGIQADRALIYDRINQRVDAMVQAGLVEEAKRLYPSRDLNALQTVGYRELFEYFDGKTTLEVAIEEIKKNTRRFAKRQLTWLRKNKEILWVEFGTPMNEILEDITKELNKRYGK
nr:tRNA (adenosine(37)-N6)-dimethylallyltransferase MiaA [Allomuricauda sp.]